MPFIQFFLPVTVCHSSRALFETVSAFSLPAEGTSWAAVPHGTHTFMRAYTSTHVRFTACFLFLLLVQRLDFLCEGETLAGRRGFGPVSATNSQTKLLKVLTHKGARSAAASFLFLLQAKQAPPVVRAESTL